LRVRLQGSGVGGCSTTCILFISRLAGGLAANCTDEQYVDLLEQMVPIAEQVAEKLNLQ
jgi:hypothetical protein